MSSLGSQADNEFEGFSAVNEIEHASGSAIDSPETHIVVGREIAFRFLYWRVGSSFYLYSKFDK